MSTYVLAGGIRPGSSERLVVAAAMTPALHGIQAWRFKVIPGLIEVLADQGRFRTMDDPNGRSLHLSCGAALLNLRLAAAQLGREPVVRLLPDRTRPSLLASVRLAGSHRTSPSERLLYAATMRPMPTPGPYGSQPPPLSVANELTEAARLEGASLNPGDSDGTYVLSTRGDGPAEWLRAGQALQRILITAAAGTSATSFTYEAVPLPTQASAHPNLQSGDIPQALIHLGAASPLRSSRAEFATTSSESSRIKAEAAPRPNA